MKIGWPAVMALRNCPGAPFGFVRWNWDDLKNGAVLRLETATHYYFVQILDKNKYKTDVLCCDKEGRPNVVHYGEFRSPDDFEIGKGHSTTEWKVVEKIDVL